MKLYWDLWEPFQTESTQESIERRNNVQDQLPGYPGLFFFFPLCNREICCVGHIRKGFKCWWWIKALTLCPIFTAGGSSHSRTAFFFFSLSWLSDKTAPFHTHYLYPSLSVSLFFLELARRQLCAVLIDGVTQALQQNIFELLIKRRQAGNVGEWEDWLLLRTPSHLRSAPLSLSMCVYLCVHAGVPHAALMRTAGRLPVERIFND